MVGLGDRWLEVRWMWCAEMGKRNQLSDVKSQCLPFHGRICPVHGPGTYLIYRRDDSSSAGRHVSGIFPPQSVVDF